MRSSFFTFRVANTGMHTARSNLNVTSHNVANMGIPGFSRQVTVQSALQPIHLRNGRGMYGTGSGVHNVIQLRDQFVDRRFWHQQGILGEFEVKVPQLSLIEAMFNDLPENSAVGVLGAFNNFFTQMQALSVNANDPTFRLNVVKTGDTIANLIRNNAEALQQQQRDLNGEVRAVVTEINSLGRQITSLNLQIRNFEFDGSNANDLRDERNRLIDRLSSLANIRVEERDFSSTSGIENDMRVLISINGEDFIQHNTYHALEVVPRTAAQRRNAMDVDGLYDIRFADGSPFNIFSRNLGGTLRGLIDMRDGNGGVLTEVFMGNGAMLIQSQINALRQSGVNIDNLRNSIFDPAALITQRDGLVSDLAIREGELAGYRAGLPAAAVLAGRIDAIRSALAASGLSPGDDEYDEMSDIIDQLEALLSHASLNDGILNVTEFNALLGELRDLFDDNSISDATLDALFPPADITVVNNIAAALADIAAYNSAIAAIDTQLAQLPTIATNLVAELNAAVTQAQSMYDRIAERILAIQNGEEEGDYEEYQAFLDRIVDYIDDLETARDGLEAALAGVDMTDPAAVYAALTAAAAHLDAAEQIIEDLLLAAAEELNDGFIPGRTTTIFRGIPFYQNRLNEMVRTFVLAINEGQTFNPDGTTRNIEGALGHRNGWSLQGTTGLGFFTWDDPLGTAHGHDNPGNFRLLNALNFSINGTLLDYPHLLQCSSAPNIGESDNAVVAGFIHINNYASLFREGQLIDFIIATGGFLSVDTQQSVRFRRNYHEMSVATQNQRAALSDVDMNEELLNMSRFSHLYQVNARMIATMRDVYDTLVNRLGVG